VYEIRMYFAIKCPSAGHFETLAKIVGDLGNFCLLFTVNLDIGLLFSHTLK